MSPFRCVCVCVFVFYLIFMLGTTVLYEVMAPQLSFSRRHYNNNLFAFCICIAFKFSLRSISFIHSFIHSPHLLLFIISAGLLSFIRSVLIKIIWWQIVSIVLNEFCFVYLYYISFMTMKHFSFILRTQIRNQPYTHTHIRIRIRTRFYIFYELQLRDSWTIQTVHLLLLPFFCLTLWISVNIPPNKFALNAALKGCCPCRVCIGALSKSCQ